MEAFEPAVIIQELRRSGRSYEVLLRSGHMSAGIYVLPGGGNDGQSPHHEDEIYYVIGGRAKITVGDEVRPVSPGSTVFVAAEVEHRFLDIEEDLAVLVVFAPPETE